MKFHFIYSNETYAHGIKRYNYMTELEKLKHLLQHWMEHNNAHVKTYTEWAEKAEALERKDFSES